MAQTTFHSFQELAKVFGTEAVAETVKINESAFNQVKAAAGYNAAKLFAYLQYAEATNNYGIPIIHTPYALATATGMGIEQVKTEAIKLMKLGFARPTTDGMKVKAA